MQAGMEASSGRALGQLESLGTTGELRDFQSKIRIAWKRLCIITVHLTVHLSQAKMI